MRAREPVHIRPKSEQPETHDFVNCPTCHGRGVVPLETAERIEVHVRANSDEAATARKQSHSQELDRRVAAAEKRKRDLENLLYSEHQVTVQVKRGGT